jgi:hypothetical protein
MRSRQLVLPLAITGILIVAALAVALGLLAPDKLKLALVGGLNLPLLWGVFELLAKGDRLHVRVGVIAASLLLTIALGAKVAQAAGWIGPDDARLGFRLFGIAGSLLLMFFGNRIPKVLQRYDPTADQARRQAFQRQAGWTVVLAGLASGLLWVVLPVDRAAIWGTAVVGTAMVLVVARVVQCRLRGRKA